ncbi:MAG: tRNA (N6-isopentenyl adenosine(37)-C2)-methylthiotransferase MiaB [Vampirovibrio sp.]|nr:tRNA (N6-isopentenyl adenosine(37)-C2)-methylthiotransferase MiaB [Vampirovibrio sp.]
MVIQAEPKKVFIETLGCQMNKSDSELMLGLLVKEGFEAVFKPDEADLLIINTCQIRGSAEDKAYSYMGRWNKLKKKRPEMKIAMAGCVAQQTKEEVFKRAPYVDMVFGTQNIQDLPRLLRESFEGSTHLSAVDRQKPRSTYDYFTDVSAQRQSDVYAWVTIIEGCDYFCTYCVVPYTRGRQISRAPESILREVNELAASGFKEVTLLGQTVDAYGKDFQDRSYGLASLLHELNEVPGLERIRFMTSHPLDLTDDIIDAIATLPKVMEYIHIPMQAGDDVVLDRMRRGYTAAQYYELVDKIHHRIPNVAVTGDYIVGFPGETEEQFQHTLDSVVRSNIDVANTAAYSPRKQTPAGIWETEREEGVDDDIKQERLQRLNAAITEQSARKNAPYLGQTVEVLVEGVSRRNNERLMGRTRSNKVVNFESSFSEDDLVGKLISVRITDAPAWSLTGVHTPENKMFQPLNSTEPTSCDLSLSSIS